MLLRHVMTDQGASKHSLLRLGDSYQLISNIIRHKFFRDLFLLHRLLLGMSPRLQFLDQFTTGNLNHWHDDDDARTLRVVDKFFLRAELCVDHDMHDNSGVQGFPTNVGAPRFSVQHRD